jgi:hypothetical protein
MGMKVPSYADILSHRWLSKNKTPQRLLSLLQAIRVLLSDKDNQSLWRCKLISHLASVRDICGHLDDLNSRLHATCQFVRVQYCNVLGFRMESSLFLSQFLISNTFRNFPKILQKYKINNDRCITFSERPQK